MRKCKKCGKKLKQDEEGPLCESCATKNVLFTFFKLGVKIFNAFNGIHTPNSSDSS